MDKKVYYLTSSIGTAVGSYVPILFGANGLSVWSILSGGIGGIGAIYLTYKLAK